MKVGVAIAFVVSAACAHHGGPPVAPHATADAAEPLFVDWRESSAAFPAARDQNVVIAAANDWYVFGVERACRSVAVAVESKRPLALAIVKPDGTTLSARTVARRKRAPVDVTRIDNAEQGHYYIRVQARGDATPYRLVVHDATNGFECGDVMPPQPSATARPRSAIQAPAPAGTIGAQIDAWLRYDHDPGAGYIAEIAAGFDDGVRHTKAVVLDHHGEPVPGVELRVEAYEAHRARGELVGDATLATTSWSVAMQPEVPPPPPLTARVVDRWTRDGTTFVAFDRGSIDGVAVGWRGTAGRAPLEVVEVHGIRGVARLPGTSLDAIVGLGAMQLWPSKQAARN